MSLFYRRTNYSLIRNTTPVITFGLKLSVCRKVSTCDVAELPVERARSYTYLI